MTRRDKARWWFGVGLVVGAVSYSACSPLQPTPEQADADVAAMRFVRHANGLCFGVVRFATHNGFQGVSVTHVPDAACKDGR